MTEDNELIEHIARGIFRVDSPNAHQRGEDANWHRYEQHARAALTAYRNHEVEL